MLNSDEHLERALTEYNDKVSALEDSGPREKLLEALVNRGCVLFMMDSYVSAYGDFDDASDIIAEIEDSGGSVDPGLYVKTHAMKGMTIVEKSVHEAAEEFRLAATRLGQLKPGARHFPDGRAIADFCLDCAQTLIDEDMGADALPFTEKSMSQTVGKDDAWSRNRYMEACSMEADALSGSEDPEKAGEYFDEAVRTGESLRASGELEDDIMLVDAYVGRAELCKGEEFIGYAEKAERILEDLEARHALEDRDLLSQLCGEIAQAYMGLHKMKEAEKYLMKQVKLSIGAEPPRSGDSAH
ncbi:MAG: hypothetical protein LKJ94_00565 [Candidatus Methanomethylophilus sp.]|jgi:tetratricopeptide (TPR) repeat protein|nr:hypothetical protein [Methanomethylophilus sp.]MCI2074193.1 hypothetical protein [Methanomethylophilus sp.]MCI2093010.1 hypothetical protein [Methanomethylophilus sp.]